MSQNPQSNTVWEDKFDVVQEFITIQSFGQLMVSQWNSSGIFFQDMETPAPSGSVLLALSPSLSEGHSPSVQL